jgi:hypothetical protein
MSYGSVSSGDSVAQSKGKGSGCNASGNSGALGNGRGHESFGGRPEWKMGNKSYWQSSLPSQFFCFTSRAAFLGQVFVM